jgi:hypothetical protein
MVERNQQMLQPIRKNRNELRQADSWYGNNSGTVHCKVIDVGLNSFYLCLERESGKCIYSVQYGDEYYCKFPLHCHAAKRDETG